MLNPETIITKMAAVLRDAGTDLGDERAVIRDLRAAGFAAGDILALMDSVIEHARTITAAKASLEDR
jgi:hypothetical protein